MGRAHCGIEPEWGEYRLVRIMVHESYEALMGRAHGGMEPTWGERTVGWSLNGENVDSCVLRGRCVQLVELT